MTEISDSNYVYTTTNNNNKMMFQIAFLQLSHLENQVFLGKDRMSGVLRFFSSLKVPPTAKQCKGHLTLVDLLT